MFYKKIVAKKSPHLVVFLGSAGKSISINLAQHIFNHVGLTVDYDISKNKLSALLKRNSKISYLFKEEITDFPDYLFYELHEGARIDPDLWSLFSSITLIIPFISSQDEERFGSVKKYILSHFPELESYSKEMNCIFSQDIDGIEKAITDIGFKQVQSVSTGLEADIYLENQEYRFKHDSDDDIAGRVTGIAGKLIYNGSTIPFQLRGVIGSPHVNALFLALVLIQQTQVNMIDAIHAASNATPLAGRLKIIPGIKKTTLIDDSYSSSFESSLLSVTESARVEIAEGKKRYCILSDIMDLEAQTESGHCFVGEYIAKHEFDVAVFVGERSRDAARCAVDAGLSADVVHHFQDKNRAGREVQNLIRQGDLILIKGDQEARFETVVKELMAFPLQANKELLKR